MKAGIKGPAPGGGFDWRVLLSGLSSALPVYAQHRANRDAQEDILAGQNEIAGHQARADRMIGDQISEIRASGPEAERDTALQDYSAAVARNKASAGAPAPTPALGGGRSEMDRQAADRQGALYARQQAGFAAGVDAPSRQREREAISANRRAGDVKAVGQPIGTAAFLAKLRANRRQPNPWIALLSQLGGQIANNYVRPDEELTAPAPEKDARKLGRDRG